MHRVLVSSFRLTRSSITGVNEVPHTRWKAIVIVSLLLQCLVFLPPFPLSLIVRILWPDDVSLVR
jgi:hypothetical protein